MVLENPRKVLRDKCVGHITNPTGSAPSSAATIDRAAYRPIRLMLDIIATMRQLCPAQIEESWQIRD